MTVWRARPGAMCIRPVCAEVYREDPTAVDGKTLARLGAVMEWEGQGD